MDQIPNELVRLIFTRVRNPYVYSTLRLVCKRFQKIADHLSTTSRVPRHVYSNLTITSDSYGLLRLELGRDSRMLTASTIQLTELNELGERRRHRLYLDGSYDEYVYCKTDVHRRIQRIELPRDRHLIPG